MNIDKEIKNKIDYAEEPKILYAKSDYPFQSETFKIIGLCMEIHNELGCGSLEEVYKDAMEYEFRKNSIPYEREKSFQIHYKDVILKKPFRADFITYGNIILEIKAQNSIIEKAYKQAINYLSVTKFKLGLLINFGESSLKFKRIIK